MNEDETARAFFRALKEHSAKLPIEELDLAAITLDGSANEGWKIGPFDHDCLIQFVIASASAYIYYYSLDYPNNDVTAKIERRICEVIADQIIAQSVVFPMQMWGVAFWDGTPSAGKIIDGGSCLSGWFEFPKNHILFVVSPGSTGPPAKGLFLRKRIVPVA